MTCFALVSISLAYVPCDLPLRSRIFHTPPCFSCCRRCRTCCADSRTFFSHVSVAFLLYMGTFCPCLVRLVSFCFLHSQTGRWKCILHAYPFHPKRTAVDLKDKWRNILRKQERQRTGLMKEATATAAAPMSSPGDDAFVSAANIRCARVCTSRAHEGTFSTPSAAGTSTTQLKPRNGLYSSNWAAFCSDPLPSASSPARAVGSGIAGGVHREVCYAMSDCSDGGVSSWPEVETDIPVDSLSQILVADFQSPMCREGGVGRLSSSPVLCGTRDDDAPSRMKVSFLLCS
jgi:hypothetical protein